MNPQANIAYCIKHVSFVNGLREKRGGWQEWDWGWDTVVGELIPPSIGDRVRLLGDVWLPTEGDALGMLAEALPRLGEGDYGWALEGANDADRYQAWIPGYLDEGTGFLDEDIYRTDWLETPLIALLELLRAVEGKGE